MRNKHKWYLLPLLGLAFLLLGSIASCEKQASPPSPVIAISPSSFSFSIEQGEPNTPSQILSIRNSGSGMLSWSISDSASWLSGNPTSGSSSGESKQHNHISQYLQYKRGQLCRNYHHLRSRSLQYSTDSSSESDHQAAISGDCRAGNRCPSY